MKWIIILIAWLLLSFPAAVFTGKFIKYGHGASNMKGSDNHADAGKNQVAD